MGMLNMTFKEYFTDKLYNCGLFKNQCEEVINLCKKDEVFVDAMGDRWDDIIDSYPDMLKTIIWIRVKSITLKYIDMNIPEAWFRSLFL